MYFENKITKRSSWTIKGVFWEIKIMRPERDLILA